jgi:hypothetical protein
MKDLNVRQVFLYLLIGSIGLSAAVGIVVIILGSFGTIEVRILMTTLTVTATSILGLACGAYYETGRGRVLPMVGIALSVIAAIMTLLIVWDVLDESKTFIKSSVTVLIGAVAASHLSLLMIARLDRRFAWSRIAAIVLIGTLSGLLIFLVWADPDTNSELIARTLGVLSILVGAVTVMTPVFHKLSHEGGRDPDEIMSEIETLKRRLEELENEKAVAISKSEY